MSFVKKSKKLLREPKKFFIDYKKKRIKDKPVNTKPSRSVGAAKTELIPSWFKSTPSVQFKEALKSGKPIYVYIPWIEGHTNSLIDKVNNSEDYKIIKFDIFKNINNDIVRRKISAFIRSNPFVYRRMLASRLIPIKGQIKGVIFSFDWAPVMRVCSNLCEELSIPRILIPHESVFADKSKYYVDMSGGAEVPVADVILGWGDLQKEIFADRGYPVNERFITVGAPKFDIYANYKPQLSRDEFANLFGLDSSKPIILFASQPLDSQFDDMVTARNMQAKAISDLLDYCEDKKAQMILRLPPSKDRVIDKDLEDKINSSNIASIDDSLCYLVAPEEAIYHSNVTVSVNSTMLFEAMLMGRPSVSTKYISFEQMWKDADIPAVRNKKELYNFFAKTLPNKSWQPSAKGLDWAARQLSNGKFDGQASARISKYLSEVALNKTKISLRENPLQRVIFNNKDSNLPIIGIHIQKRAIASSLRYLMPLLECRKMVIGVGTIANKINLSAIDLYIQWGITKNSSKLSQNTIRKSLGRPLLYLEDGFIRSMDIGLSGTPALSLILDDQTSYYDATKPSRLQMLLESEQKLTPEQLNRASKAIREIVKYRISKYNHAPDIKLDIATNGRKKILLVDQRYGDQSVESGLANSKTFQNMLNDAINNYPNHDILIKRHPDAIKGGKVSYYSDENVAEAIKNPNVYSIDSDANPYSLFDIVEEVFVATSGMGFEALMAGKKVTCYGVPYYSGWGITNDIKTIPTRTKKRTIEEVFYFSYIFLSRYYSPELKRRCEIEELIEYIVEQKKLAGD